MPNDGLENPVSVLVSIFGSQKAVAKVAECDPAVVTRWKACGQVALGYWGRLRAAAGGQAYRLSGEVLSGVAEHPAPEVQNPVESDGSSAVPATVSNDSQIMTRSETGS